MHQKNYELLKELSKNDFQKFYDLGIEYERAHYGCAQCTLAPFVSLMDVDQSVFSTASGFAGGIGQMGDACGAYVAGVMMIGYLFGRTFEDLEGDHEEAVTKFRYTCEIARRYREKFVNEFDSINCKGVQCKMFGRSFDIMDKENDYPEFIAQGAHTTKCPVVVAKAAKMTAQVLYDEYKRRF